MANERRQRVVRVSDALARALDDEGRRQGRSRADLAATLLEEGLRMLAHPGVVFRDGPAGRRPGLAGGPDIWEIARVLPATEDCRGEHDEWAAFETIGRALSLSPASLRVAARYYATYRDEIDDWIRLNDEEATLAETEWLHAARLAPV